MAAPQYATLDDLKELIDEQFLKMLSTDDGTDGNIAALANNPNLRFALERASSDVESSAMQGKRYSASDLVSFQAAGDSTLRGLVCDLTAFHLAARRCADLPPAIEERYRHSKDMLKALKGGEMIFGKSAAAAAAGVVSIEVIVPTKRANYNPQMMSDQPFFPRRQQREIP